MNEEIQKLKEEVRALREEIRMLKSPATVPLEIAAALSERIDVLRQQDAKTKSSETITVNEGGGSVWNVLGEPDGFDYAVVDGQVRYYPFFLP